jgi:hypothetical protein
MIPITVPFYDLDRNNVGFRVGAHVRSLRTFPSVWHFDIEAQRWPSKS